MTIFHKHNHVSRAPPEAAAYQIREFFEAICSDSNMALRELRVGGSVTTNRYLIQFQADIICIPVIRSQVKGGICFWSFSWFVERYDGTEVTRKGEYYICTVYVRHGSI